MVHLPHSSNESIEDERRGRPTNGLAEIRHRSNTPDYRLITVDGITVPECIDNGEDV